MRRILCGLCLLARDAAAQSASPVADALRATFETIGPRIQLAAEAMPADRYTFRPSVGELTFGETVAVIANYSSLYCGALTGLQDPNPGSDETTRRDSVTTHLRAKFGYCVTALARLTDTSLGDTVRFDWPKTKATLVQELVEFWALRYQYLTTLMRRDGIIPPVPCSGAGGRVDCGSGVNLCSPHRVPLRGGLTAVLSDGPYAVRSDQKGPYRQGTSNVATVVAGRAGVIVLANPSVPASERRAILIDLDRPVPGDIGVPLGVIRDDQDLEVAGQWESDPVTHRPRTLLDIRVGRTVPAHQIDVEFDINGVIHALQAGPQPIGHCYSDGTAVHGRGTTTGTITRADTVTWVVELPPGSKARLFEVNHRYPHAVNKGLYYVSLRLTLRQSR